MHNVSCENKFYLHEKEQWFPYQRLSTYPRFEKEARGNSELAYSLTLNMLARKTIGPFRVAPSHCFKARLSVTKLTWKCVFLLSCKERKVLHSFWKWGVFVTRKWPILRDSAVLNLNKHSENDCKKLTAQFFLNNWFSSCVGSRRRTIPYADQHRAVSRAQLWIPNGKTWHELRWSVSWSLQWF